MSKAHHPDSRAPVEPLKVHMCLMGGNLRSYGIGVGGCVTSQKAPHLSVPRSPTLSERFTGSCSQATWWRHFNHGDEFLQSLMECLLRSMLCKFGVSL